MKRMCEDYGNEKECDLVTCDLGHEHYLCLNCENEANERIAEMINVQNGM